MDVKDKVIVITGAASGIGFCCAEELLHHHVKFIAILDLPMNGEIATTKLKNQFGEGRVDFFPCDITKNDQVDMCFNKIMELFGGFDVLINSAGLLYMGEKWELMNAVNINGITRTTIKAIETMGTHKGGKGCTIVNVASMAGLTPVRYLPLYAATKYAIVGLTASLALSYEKTGVRLMLMCPGITNTPLSTNTANDVSYSFIDIDESLQDVRKSAQQPPEAVSKAMIQLIEKGENGAACVVYKSDAYLVSVPTIKDLMKHPL